MGGSHNLRDALGPPSVMNGPREIGLVLFTTIGLPLGFEPVSMRLLVLKPHQNVEQGSPQRQSIPTRSLLRRRLFKRLGDLIAGAYCTRTALIAECARLLVISSGGAGSRKRHAPR